MLTKSRSSPAPDAVEYIPDMVYSEGSTTLLIKMPLPARPAMALIHLDEDVWQSKG